MGSVSHETSVGRNVCHLVFLVLHYCTALHDVACCLPVQRDRTLSWRDTCVCLDSS